jgi:hypothetical protein
MARFVLRGSIPSKISIVLLCILAFACLQPPVASAQHAGGHFGGAGARVFVPPISHPAISRPPLAVRPPATAFRNGSLLYRPNPFRPHPPFYPIYGFYGSAFFGAQSWWFWTTSGYNSCWWTSCYLFWSLGYPYSALPFYQYPSGNVSVYQYPRYVYGGQSRDYPQLYLQDGTVLTVTDYWLVDDQLHFRMVEDGGKSVEHVIAVDALDLQTTVDVNTRRGFRFVLRNEPMEEYLQHHPDQAPPTWTPSPKN